MTEPKTGDFCKLYCDTGSSATPVWTEWGEVDGVSCSDLQRSSVELNVRCLTATPSLPGKIGALTLTFAYYPGFSDTNYAQLLEDFFTKPTVRKWAMMDGDITTAGTQGLQMPCYEEGIPYSQAAAEAVKHDVTLKYGFKKEGATVLTPTWVTIPAATESSAT